MRIPLEDNEKKILINVEDDETRTAVVDNATLDNLYIEQTHRTQILGNIYFGKVVKSSLPFRLHLSTMVPTATDFWRFPTSIRNSSNQTEQPEEDPRSINF